MAFRGVLPEVPSFGTQLARGLGGGLGAGISSAADFAQKLALKRATRNPYEELQQSRLAADSLFKQYSTRIKEMQNYLNSGMYGKGEAENIRQTIKNLQDERDSMFGWSQKVKEPTVSSPEPAGEPVAQEPTKKKAQKVKFNPKNPEHVAKFEQLDKEFKGDKKKVNDALSREFTL